MPVVVLRGDQRPGLAVSRDGVGQRFGDRFGVDLVGVAQSAGPHDPRDKTHKVYGGGPGAAARVARP